MRKQPVINLNIGMMPLTIVFVLLKALGYIDWSWWWIFAPLWAPFAILGVIALGVFLIVFVWTFFSSGLFSSIWRDFKNIFKR
jgi:hypothetical protein